MRFTSRLLENLKKKLSKGIKYLLCAIDIVSKYARIVPLKDKKGISIVNAFQKIISQGRKPNKMCVDQGSDLYNNSFKYFLKINLKNKIFKHMIAISKNIYFNLYV